MDTEPSNKTQPSPDLKWHQTPLFLAITIGIPFCIFKYLFGTLTVHVGVAHNNYFIICCGLIVIMWAAIDFVMNLIKILFHVMGRRLSIEFCLIAQIGRTFGHATVFLAIDTLLSFLIICFVLWSGWIKNLGLYESYMWYTATTLNLISISIVNIFNELHLKAARKTDLQGVT